jgi:hypothetical protein
MSRKMINQIIGLAAIDPAFWQALQERPMETLEARGFQLTAEERAIFLKITALPFPEFCQSLLELLERQQDEH